MAAEKRELLFYPQIPGDVQLRTLWYMQHRRRPMTPAPCNTPMPDKQKDAEQKARCYSTYLRPWTLDPSIATSEVPYIANLDVVMLDDAGPCPAQRTEGGKASDEHPKAGVGPCPAQSEKATTASQGSPNKRVRLRSKTVDETQPQRSYAMAWSTYIRGNVVTRHAARLITQFMAACCGTTKNHDNEDEPDEGPGKHHNIPDNTLPLERVHNILDRMSAMESRAPKAKTRKRSEEEEEEKKEVEEDDFEAASRALQQSEVVSTAMQMTARLWSRTAQQWPDYTPTETRASLHATSATASVEPKRRLTKKRSQRPKKVQAAAYIAWKETDVQQWLKNLDKETHPPNRQQREFITCIVERCRQEHQQFKKAQSQEKQHRDMYDDEPLRCCLLGIPGAGKSTCIHYMRRFFEECLKWEDGVQFQFLASQNTMAALISGQTLHSWGQIPINASNATAKVQTKAADGDIDILFLNALGMRWIVIDEISTVSPTLLGLLESYLRRACCRHPYARHKKRHRPFGGINIIFAGDFWQLPPVKQVALFSNPFKKGAYSSEEQTILKMFWCPETVDSIQRTFLLTEPMRTKDMWLRAVLEAERLGDESWELYCFIHGFPTRNVGTWLPGSPKPWCNNSECARLSTEVWPEMWRRGHGTAENWRLRQEKECTICKQERRRRCCVLLPRKTEDHQKLQQAPFDAAPFVHPFRHPSYHATQLRAIAFAKSKQTRLFWVTAYDKVVTGSLATTQDREETRKEHLLEYHDRFTGGIPGLLPLALNLPVRFTEHINSGAREMGIFKHTRGILREWEITEDEAKRIEGLTDWEVVLWRRPTKLYIEVPTGTRLMPTIGGRKIYTLTCQVKPWSLDKAGAIKIKRFGFPIVPDFGGTAHAYCGSTLDAAIGDCLSWDERPRREGMLRAYIIKSRVREAENMLIVQAYSPHLFRQGMLPGPQLLLDVLLKRKTTKEVQVCVFTL